MALRVENASQRLWSFSQIALETRHRTYKRQTQQRKLALARPCSCLQSYTRAQTRPGLVSNSMSWHRNFTSRPRLFPAFLCIVWSQDPGSLALGLRHLEPSAVPAVTSDNKKKLKQATYTKWNCTWSFR